MNPATEIEVGSLQEFVHMLCSRDPAEPGTQIMDIVNVENANELGDVCVQIFMYMWILLHANEELIKRYFLSLSIRVYIETPDDLEFYRTAALLPQTIRLPDLRVVAFEFIRVAI